MYRRLESVRLRTGELVEAGVVTGPDLAWAAALERLLIHKGDPWNWQNTAVLRRPLGIDVRFYILHRQQIPFANTMLATYQGVGLFAHVWTNPEDRQKGAASLLLQTLMADFQASGGRALHLHTAPASVPFRLYETVGFHGIEPASGHMQYFHTSEADFLASYFSDAPVTIQPLTWQHWPAAQPLFMGNWPGVVRCAPLRLLGRGVAEGELLPPLREADQQRTQAVVLVNKATTAVCGLAYANWHPIWRDVCLLDVYCHPNYWHHAADLLARLGLPPAKRLLAYGDSDCPQKTAVFTAAGFRETAVWPSQIPKTAVGDSHVNVIGLEKQHTTSTFC